MSLVLGVGLRAGTSYGELRALVDAALAGVEPAVVSRVVTMAGRESEPGLQELAASFGVELAAVPAGSLAAQDVPSPSSSVERLAGTPSVAEAAVLLSGAELVVPKQRSAGATVAVGRLPITTTERYRGGPPVSATDWG